MTKTNSSQVIDPLKLVFTGSVPAAGPTIIVTYATNRWALDDTHPGALGRNVMAKAARWAVQRAVIALQGKMGVSR
jgi:hypothetical protein